MVLIYKNMFNYIIYKGKEKENNQLVLKFMGLFKLNLVDKQNFHIL